MYYNYSVCCGEKIHKSVPQRKKTYYCRKCKALHTFHKISEGFLIETRFPARGVTMTTVVAQG